ncbi:sigma factor-like helix-turn-helix DNA-binding protein [Candidatus Palauibacter sp.]|uniref:sigma factor-like helix-turn-helix DNA-binding protein n=1 Tax=Candidatus Palauibacter sp. TaxID=3101350 RepID=UPI003CC59B0B
MKLTDLAAAWRDEADLFAKRGQGEMAEMARSFAADLEHWIRLHDLQQLTIREAAEELGLSYSAVQKRIADGKLSNAGRKSRPRVRRCDLVGDVLALRVQAD